MANFRNDYWMGMHPNVLQAVIACNDMPDKGYGEDILSAEAARRVAHFLAYPDAEVHLVPSCTQANSLVPAAALRSCEAIISAVTGHINVHEAGAVESGGHKIIPVPTTDGKLTPALIIEAAAAFSGEHMVVPKMVYVSNSTELGTVYSRRELIDIREVCDEHDFYLYLDGARLGQALTTGLVSVSDVAACADAFTIGCTKNGAMAGEALVLMNSDFCPNFRNLIKQRGAMLAKGKFIGAQIAALFSEDALYMQLARHAQTSAHMLRDGIAELGYPFSVNSQTNQIFPIFPMAIVEKLQMRHEFYLWQTISPDKAVIRLVTSWMTTDADVNALLNDLSRGPE